MTKVFCILGMHRSGTSCLAGSMEEAGLHFGEVNTSALFNKKGNRENQRIMDLHDEVLRCSEGSWSAPPDQVRWSDDHRMRRDAIIRSYRDIPVWGFKDPRTLLLLDFWREAISDLTFVATFRHPALVAESLRRRNGRTMHEWLNLWTEYNGRILSLHETNPFPVVRFDLQESDYRRSVMFVMSGLGLTVPPRMAFFDPALRHLEPTELPQVPEGLDPLYRSLCRMAEDSGPSRSSDRWISRSSVSGEDDFCSPIGVVV